MAEVLKMEHIVKKYANCTALDDVNLSVTAPLRKLPYQDHIGFDHLKR